MQDIVHQPYYLVLIRPPNELKRKRVSLGNLGLGSRMTMSFSSLNGDMPLPIFLAATRDPRAARIGCPDLRV